MYDCSHRLCASHDDSDIIRYHRKMERIVTVKQNCFIIFHGGLIHAGAPFDSTKRRHRIHISIHPPDYVKLDAKTYKSDIVGCNQDCAQCTKKFEHNGM